MAPPPHIETARHAFRVVTAVTVAGVASVAVAGMPAPLPSDFETVRRLTDSAHERVQAISFFVAGVLLSALLVRWLWNGVRRDFPRLPRLRYRTALGVVLLWGLLFVIVLTMIAGARELMTPGAWEKQGLTYKLTGSAESRAASLAEREPRVERLDELRAELLRFAALNGGRYPESLGAEATASLRDVPGFPGLSYVYVSGLTVEDVGRVLVYEPEIEHNRRLVLTADGETREMTSEELIESVGGTDRR
ncbi:MAG TPA: hypothetical protein VF170_14535 [Planctomycetaceae bacterium]